MLTVEIAERSDAGLLRRAAGRYYTPECIGRPMARALASLIRNRPADGMRLVDPFGGDGRLLVWLLQEAVAHLQGASVTIEVWDLDGPGVAKAVRSLEDEAERLGIDAFVTGRVANSFAFATQANEQFDVVVTNPPWERLKPDPRDLDALDKLDRDSYIAAIREADTRLESAWPLSQPTRKWGGWGTNLSRVGIEVAHWICRPNGAVGVVTPSSFLADSTSVPLRQAFLMESRLREVAFYPAEMRAFEGADVDSATIVATKAPPAGQAFKLHQVDRFSQESTQGDIHLTMRWLTEHDWAVPVTVPPAALQVIESLADLPRLGDAHLEGKPFRLGRELDESGHRQWTATHGRVPFVKGRDIDFMQVSDPSLFLSDPARAGSQPSRGFSRVIWRDVTRPSQPRRLVPAVLEPGPVTGNSVGVGWLPTEQSHTWAAATAGLMASVISETQARALLATNHMSKSVVAKLRLPTDWTRHSTRLEALSESVRAQEPAALIHLEVAVSRLFQLELEEWNAMADAVPGVSDAFREGVSSQW